VLLETEPDMERRENVSAARFRDTESHTAGVGLMEFRPQKSELEVVCNGTKPSELNKRIYGLISRNI
jgi:hypothetical protein